MTLLSALRVALNALTVHQGRSVLTSLGIVIGTAAVIAMVSAAGGARQILDERLRHRGQKPLLARRPPQILDERLDNVGKNLILVRSGSRTQNGALADVKAITNEEANLLRKQL